MKNQKKQEQIHIPCGFRCLALYPESWQVQMTQPTLPFDAGFFPPESIIRFLNAEKVEINMENTSPCIKTEYYIENNILGIKFEESNYKFINNHINENGYDGTPGTPGNRYLDGTAGYYTLCKEYGFVLAHYNWHPISDKGITDPNENVNIINNIFTRRKHRLLEWIDNAKEINLYFVETQKYMFMRVDENRYGLCDAKLKLLNYFQNKYKDKQINFRYAGPANLENEK